jgi:acetolactate synthase regulatory subunit
MPTDLDIEREFADIIETLREDRMEVDPFFARELDARVANGFPKDRWRPSFGGFGAPALALTTLVAVVVGISSVNGGGDDAEVASTAGSAQIAEDSGGSGGGTASDDSELNEFQAAREESKKRAKSSPTTPAATGAAPVAGGGSPRTDARDARKQETSASLVLGAKPGGVQNLVQELMQITERNGGFVMSSSVDSIEGGGGANLELRIKSDRLQTALSEISRVADVRERREASQDITQEFVSARSRLADARAERTGLLRQLAKATDEITRERVKQQLREVSGRISAAKTDLARVNNRATYSTVLVQVVGDPAAGAEEDDGVWTPGDAFDDAMRVLEVAAGVALVALAISLPLALIGALALLLARLTQRRRRERLLDAI